MKFQGFQPFKSCCLLIIPHYFPKIVRVVHPFYPIPKFVFLFPVRYIYMPNPSGDANGQTGTITRLLVPWVIVSPKHKQQDVDCEHYGWIFVFPWEWIWWECSFGDPSFLRKKEHYSKKNCTYLVSLCFDQQVGDTIVDRWPQLECDSNVLPILFAIRQPLYRHDSQSQNLSTALPAQGLDALQRVIGWELSYTCIITS